MKDATAWRMADVWLARLQDGRIQNYLTLAGGRGGGISFLSAAGT